MISNSTRRLTGGMFSYRDLGKVRLKGLADPVQAWQVTGTSTVQSRFEAKHESSLTPLVGRDEELELLLRRWQRAKNGEGQVVLLSGERAGDRQVTTNGSLGRATSRRGVHSTAILRHAAAYGQRALSHHQPARTGG